MLQSHLVSSRILFIIHALHGSVWFHGFLVIYDTKVCMSRYLCQCLIIWEPLRPARPLLVCHTLTRRNDKSQARQNYWNPVLVVAFKVRLASSNIPSLKFRSNAWFTAPKDHLSLSYGFRCNSAHHSCKKNSRGVSESRQVWISQPEKVICQSSLKQVRQGTIQYITLYIADGIFTANSTVSDSL